MDLNWRSMLIGGVLFAGGAVFAGGAFYDMVWAPLTHQNDVFYLEAQNERLMRWVLQLQKTPGKMIQEDGRYYKCFEIKHEGSRE